MVLGEASSFVFAPDPYTVHMHVEDAARTADQLRVDLELLLDRLCQTGSLREVVSIYTVLDAHVHADDPRLRKDEG